MNAPACEQLLVSLAAPVGYLSAVLLLVNVYQIVRAVRDRRAK